ncbi:MAG: hypothetical protein JWR84_4108 [Caulobacter sp.]|nr:hypothetical protein [Caulobacter sp.]
MASFDTVNYSLRPNKAIQRQIVFDGLELLDRYIPLKKSLYIGFGSIWFTDFVLAHRRLQISDMISIENKPIGALRGKFNSPFKTVIVEEGDSSVVLRDIANREKELEKPWVVWLDYDRGLTREVLDDVGIVITHAPINSVLIVTINAAAGSLGKGAGGRQHYLKNLLGDSVDDGLPQESFESEGIVGVLANALQNYLVAQAVQLGRPGGLVPGFKIPYRDGSQMLTIGGVLPAPAARSAVKACLQSVEWPGFPGVPVEAPPLTLKEITALQRLLPSAKPISRAQLRRIGFDLEDEQLRTYCEHYRRYPAFLQVVN